MFKVALENGDVVAIPTDVENAGEADAYLQAERLKRNLPATHAVPQADGGDA